MKPTCEDGSMPKGLRDSMNIVDQHSLHNQHHRQALEDVVVREAKAEVDEAVVGAVVMALFKSQKIN